MKHDLKLLRNASITDLSAGKIRNADAALLILWDAGGTMHVSKLRAALSQWRPGLSWTYLFNTSDSGGYGFTATSVEQTHTTVFHHPYVKPYKGVRFYGSRSMGEHTSRRRTFWYRKARGVYAVTIEGMRRLMELGAL